MKNIILTLLYLFPFFSADAQQTSATFDPDWAAQIQAALDNAVASGGGRGVSVAARIPGQGTFIGVAGESTDGVPITSDMQFGVGSNSKLFTSVLVLKLQELGMLTLEDRVGDWLPAYPYIDPDITIRQLLSHQSGIFDFETEIDPHENFFQNMDSFVYGPDTFYYPEDVLGMIGPPHFSAGEKYSYSNTNYLIAAMIIEAASGDTYLHNLHAYILDPLGLDSTFLAAYEEPNGNVAHAWHLGDDIGNDPTTAPHSMYIGSGSIFSTAYQMVEWHHQLFAGNVISEASLDEIRKMEHSSFYGMGLAVNFYYTIPDDNIWVHGGWVPGYTSDIGFDPKREIQVCVLANDENDYAALIPVLTEIYEHYPRAQDDAAVSSVTSPAGEGCETTLYPEVTLKNFGAAPLTSVTLNYQVDNAPLSTMNWSGNLLTDETIAVTLPAVSASEGTHVFRCFTSGPNGNAEGYTSFNDEAKSFFHVNEGTEITLLVEGFEGAQFPPAGWVSGSQRMHDWGRCALSLLSGNGSAVKSNWFDGSGRSYDLEMPLVDLNGLSKPELSFNYAYGFYGPGYNDELAVQVSTDCGESYNTVFHKSGQALKTADAPELFFPDDEEWALEKINLSAYKKDEVLIRFRATTAWGNNLYLDNIRIDSKVNDLNQPYAEVYPETAIYPNPVSRTATISIYLDQSDYVTAEIFDMNGSPVITIAEGPFQRGNHQWEWNAEEVPSGIYFVRIKTSDRSESWKLIVTK